MSGVDSELKSLVENGRQMLREDDLERAHACFIDWDFRGAEWLDKHYPNTGLSAEWTSLPFSRLRVGATTSDYKRNWVLFEEAIRERLAWISKIARKRSEEIGSKAGTATTAPLTRKVFVVHGRNDGIREGAARFLEKVGLEPIILHEQPNEGRTIIEKFVEYADVGYAVVLLTADDVGGHAENELSKRARQNVILELGFFLGSLGRERVCAVYEEGVEIPSDYSGVVFVPLDSAGLWKLSVAKEIKAAGISVDLNDAV